MGRDLLFLPSSIYEKKHCHLYGVIKKSNSDRDVSTSHFVLCFESNPPLINYKKKKYDYVSIGEYQNDGKSVKLNIYSPSCSKNAVQIQLSNDTFQLLSSNGALHNISSSIVIIIYDDQVFMNSELMYLTNGDHVTRNDHFQVLASLLRNQIEYKRKLFWDFLQLFFSPTLLIVKSLLSIVSVAKPVFQFSALGVRLHGFLNSLAWAIDSLRNQRKVSLKVGNYFLATAVDVFAGVCLLYFMDYMEISSPLSDYLLKIAEEVVHSLQYLLQWLSGSPAGLKLNGPFNLMMGQFFMYHIKLWWIFLSIAQPVLELLFNIFLVLGGLGVTFQAAILSDLLALVSFHIYCIYVYAARVYYLQLSALKALWRLFLGRKHNPLRERVDSCEYSPDQLFVGTITFTILLFLLPTTLMYYVVFTTVKTVYVTSKSGSNGNPVILFVTPVADSWWTTVKCCLPDTVLHPPIVHFGQLFHKLSVGELVYPV
ncbi:Phosphatidylinositol N-acetylglucosaminyltransferase subunit Q [Frankliniella fusca]|uniref:Phosphatidylinositol N-acetylglucosaminyltransferase subunit Q n=1 Tax=Frankliniella fusca TaxID=407009 RepID=A0AAE1H094_9NEOP|nr:Phosphatidylinositol N-acetylglucosaminyltransferase subunit Q [Frankliniella fusca]